VTPLLQTGQPLHMCHTPAMRLHRTVISSAHTPALRASVCVGGAPQAHNGIMMLVVRHKHSRYRAAVSHIHTLLVSTCSRRGCCTMCTCRGTAATAAPLCVVWCKAPCSWDCCGILAGTAGMVCTAACQCQPHTPSALRPHSPGGGWNRHTMAPATPKHTPMTTAAAPYPPLASTSAPTTTGPTRPPKLPKLL
jgi:hypothetical protein